MKKTLFFALALFALLLAGTAQAMVYIDLDAPSIKKLPVAIQEFKDLSPGKNKDLDAVLPELMDALNTDLRFSNLFEIIGSNIPGDGITEQEIDFAGWRLTGAQTLITGGVLIEGDKLSVELRFFDLLKEKQVIGKRYIGKTNNPRRLIHYFADKLYEELTGRKGIFTTKIAFVSDKPGTKEVYVSDYDGKGAKQVTRNRSINLSPQWSPDGVKLLYTSYKKGWPCQHLLDLRTGSDIVVSDQKGLNIGGRFSPDGTRIALTVSTKKSPELYMLDLGTKEYKRLTNNYGIDVSPSFSPDGKSIVYISDTSGNPHIFMLDLAKENPKRLSFAGKYNSSPAWSPDGKKIAFSRSDKGSFNIWTMDRDGEGLTQLTFEGNNKNPSWSPDGRYMIFSSSVRGKSSLYIMQADGTGLMRLDTGVGNEKSPVWSPYLN